MDIDKYIGRLLDNRYEILEVIGTGGMAVVYKARCHRLNRLVAIKILKDDLSQDEEFRRRFHAEGQAVAMLSHPNIMSVYDVSTTDEADYIVMELIDGITLKQYMEKKGVLNWKETLHFAMQIAKALEHAHSRGLVHRDIKPHNIMVLKNGSVKVTDFGIARIMSKSNTLTKEALGSVHYISPEQAKGGRVDSRSDIYSLGVVMYEMMTGRPPYDGESPVAVAIQHINGGAAMPSTLNPNIPGGLEQIIMRAMALDPDQRYPSATGLLYDLEEFRKNPSILFDFNQSMGDETIQLPVVNQPAAERPAQPRNTAERVAGVRTDRPAQTNRPHPAGTGEQSAQRPAQRQNRQEPAQQQAQPNRRQQEEDEADGRNRTLTIAVIACSAVAIVAIVIFLIMLLNGGIFGQAVALAEVPSLVGQNYAELDHSKYEDFTISPGGYENNDEYEAGYIYDQTPASGTQVGKGSEIKVYVSLGPEQEEMVMQDLTNSTEESAREYLYAMDPTFRVLVKSENHDTIAEGRVCRTEPATGEVLTSGQSITIYLSSGPEVKKAKVPNVVGMNVTTAINTLKASGFDNYEIESEESLEDKDEVIRLSVDTNQEIDVTTKIIIYISEGAVKEEVPNVVGKSYDEALQALRALGFNNVTPEVEESKEAKDQVLRQSISAGTEVDTTTAITLYISEGVIRELMPNVVGSSYDQAVVTLNNAGFNNVSQQAEESNQPKGQVIRQSIQANTDTDVTSQIVLYVSTGPKNTVTVTIGLPVDRTEAYELVIMLQGETVADMTIQPGTASVTVQMRGRGTAEYEAYINGELYKTESVDFGG